LQGEGPLLTIAEISVALSGFSSVVIALRGSGPHAWSPQDRFGLGNVLGASVGTLVGSLLPFPLTYLGWSNELVWGVVNATVGILVLGAVGFLGYSVAKGSVPPRTPRVFWLFISSGFLVAGMLLLSAGGLIFPSGPSLLLFGLIWALLAAFAQLATFVLVTWSGRS
jgi:hypothetical protein